MDTNVTLEKTIALIETLKSFETAKVNKNLELQDKLIDLESSKKLVDEKELEIKTAFINSPDYATYKNETSRKIKLDELFKNSLELTQLYETGVIKTTEIKKMQYEIEKLTIEVNYHKRLLEVYQNIDKY